MAPKVETLAIGDELLDGRITDRNAGTLARQLRVFGCAPHRMTIVGDDVDIIVEALEQGATRSDIVVCSGGLGPTDDDRTRDAAAKWLGVPLKLHPESVDGIAARFAMVGMEMTPNNRRQAMFPLGAEVLENMRGTAPGFTVVHASGTRAFFLPGVPTEYGWFVERHVLPHVNGSQRPVARRTLVFFGLGESKLEHKLDGIEHDHRTVTLGYRAHFPEIHVTLSSLGDGAAERVDAVAEQILGRVGRFLVAEDDETLAGRVGSRLKAAGATVTTAESCTGGLVAQLITEVPGSSTWFERAFVTYANAAKREMIGVPAETLEAHGAVSRQTVVAMARGARRASDATYSIALSGVAGPGGGSAAKPIGTVELAVDTPDGTYYRHLGMRSYWGRSRIRQASAHHGLALLLKLLEDRVADDPRVEGPLPQDAP